MRHAHGKNIYIRALLFQFAVKLIAFRKHPAYIFGIFRRRRYNHQPAHVQVFKIVKFWHNRFIIFRAEPCFLFFARNVNLQKYFLNFARFGGFFINSLH